VDPEDQYVITTVCDGQALLTLSEYGSPHRIDTRANGYFIFGTEGVLSCRSYGSAITLEKTGQPTVELPLPEDLASEDAFLRLHRLFYEALTTDAPVPVTGADAMTNIHWAMGAYVANDTRRWVDLPLGEEWFDYYGPERTETIPGQV
jgi:hypothetical protein